MLDIKEKRHITVVGRGGASNIDWEDIENKPDFATVATSGSYNDLTDKPELFSGDYNDLTNKPDLSHYVEDTDLATVATSGSYNDLSDKPTIPAAQVNSDWNASSGVQQILNKPTLATVATSGSYNDLTDKPAVKEDLDLSTLTQAQYVDFYTSYNTYKANYSLNWGGLPIVSINSWQPDTSISPVPLIVLQYGIYGQSALMTGGDDEVYFGVQLIAADGSVTPYSSSMVFKQICHTASYNDLVDKPTLATVATSGSYNDLSDKPEIPSVPAMATETLTFTLQDGTIKTIEFYTVPNYFYIEDISGSDNTLSIKKQSDSAPDVEVFYSTDKTNWTSMGTTTTTGITATVPANGKLYLKANPTDFYSHRINANGNHNIGGNIMSLLYGDNFEGKTTFLTSRTAFTTLFMSDTKMINAESLVLPATTLNEYCYQQMFGNCSSLLTAPVLPATTLARNCYSYMFSQCSSLTTAPVLPATTLANQCYISMFSQCTSLTTAPELPATTLANQCYKQMFQGCSTLTTAPVLPATTLVSECYYDMFNGCRNLNKITTYATSVNSGSQLGWWCSNVAATGDFYNLGGATYPSGGTGIPTGWTEHTSL